MARPLGSGPIHVYFGFGPPQAIAGAPAPVTAAGALYYGTTREGPDVEEDQQFYEVKNDITGPAIPMDRGFAGREDTISLVMSSWTQSVDNRIEHFLDPTNAANPIGTNRLADLGTLMLSEGKTLGLWLVKGAAAKAVNVAAGMPLGRYYLCTAPFGKAKIIEGNKENLRVRQFKAMNNINVLNTGALPLYREDNGAFAGLPAATFG